MSSSPPAAREGHADEHVRRGSESEITQMVGRAMVTSDVRREPRVRSHLFVGRIRKFTAGGLVVGACALLSVECIAAGGETPSAAIAERPEARASRVRVGHEAPALHLGAPDGSPHLPSDLRRPKNLVLVVFP